MEGQLAEHPLAELVREIANAGLSGALRVAREPAKIVIYFESGEIVFAASNLRAHRLREALQRGGITAEQLSRCPATSSDEECAEAMLASGLFTPESLQKVRAVLAADVLRVALLWSDGYWSFNQRVRVADDLHVEVDIGRLLLECARHLPFSFVKSRFESVNGSYAVNAHRETFKLLPSEEFLLARATAVDGRVRLSDLAANGLSEEEVLRGVYGLSLSDVLQRDDWRLALRGAIRQKRKTKTAEAPLPATEPAIDEPDVDKFLARMKDAKDHYEVLDVPRATTLEQIKESYHRLARHFHPDRFHQSAPELRNRIDSAFARIAQAYETLSEAVQREEYDQKLSAKTVFETASKTTEEPPRETAPPLEQKNAQDLFRHGMDALRRKQNAEAIQLLAEAAGLEPRQGRYRAYYGAALATRTDQRKKAEAELKAALALEPDNSLFHLMLAELYQTVGLRRRAQTQAARALALDPKNEAATALLASLKKK